MYMLDIRSNIQLNVESSASTISLLSPERERCRYGGNEWWYMQLQESLKVHIVVFFKDLDKMDIFTDLCTGR